MISVSAKINEDKLTLFVSGRVDSSNAAEFEQRINKVLCSFDFDSVVLDIEQLEYISSAGLRVLLRLRKQQPATSIINASAEVFEILDMTGFTEMMPVKRAYRTVSVDGCAVIGTGATGKVYRLDDDIIVKVYYRADALPDIHRERELARKAFVLGIPTAIPFDVVRVGDKFGSVFELLKAKSLAELMTDDLQDTEKYIDLAVGLMKKINSTAVKENDLPSIKNRAILNAEYLMDRIPREKALKFKRMAEDIPDSANMIHGDLHIKNMMMQNGELLLIDMDTLSHGHPLFELEALFNAYIGYSEIDKNNTLEFFGVPYEVMADFWKQTLIKYFGTDDTDYLEQIENKVMLMGYASLYRDFSDTDVPPEGDEKRRIDAYMEHILTLIDKVDSFSFDLPEDV